MTLKKLGNMFVCFAVYLFRANILVGAPKANTSHSVPSTVVERGAVYSCPWSKTIDASCQQLQFDNSGKVDWTLIIGLLRSVRVIRLCCSLML